MTDTNISAEAVERLARAMEARIIETYGGHGTVLEMPDDDCNAAADALRALLSEIGRLREEKRSVAMDYLALDAQLEMHLTEIQRLKDKCDKQAMILRRLNPENFPDTYFICGETGEKDQNGMPQKIMVAPAYGVDFAYQYVYNGKVTGPEW